MTTVALMGSTGSIGTQTIEVVDGSDGRFEITAIGAHRNVEVLARQAHALRPAVVALADESRAVELKELLPPDVELVAGADALGSIAGSADVVVNGVVGFAGLPVTLGALRAGKRLALANKESLIAAGPVVNPLRATPGAELLPVDSEHCAIHQCLRSDSHAGAAVDRLVLTASGGPFRGRHADDLATVTVADALDHPTWSMGPKITVDSSTLVNKGLEVIEAHELFGLGYDQIDVVVHPTSIVHSMVTFRDGATIAQLSRPDMRLPIAYALAYPDRFEGPYGGLDFSSPLDLRFEPPDLEAFPCLALAYAAGRSGDTAPAWFSAANEVAVDAFLSGRIRWVDIAAVNAEALQRWDGAAAGSVDDILDADRRARDVAAELVAKVSV
jgi:1-deoxy-D-xylulose-5-phosphate reductoisomerase